MGGNLENSWCFGCVNLDVEDISVEGKSDDDDVIVDDILDRLVEDPFGMNVKSTFKAAMTQWLNDLESDLDGFKVQESDKEAGDDQRSAKGLSWVCNGAMWFQPDDIGFVVDEISVGHTGFNRSKNDNTSLNQDLNEGVVWDKPHDALFLAIGYLGMKDLLVVERVCRSLRDAVRGDPLLWRTFYVEQPLNWRITDDALLNLTNRAQGNLQCLNLTNCIHITDDGLKLVLESNPRIEKLIVPGCVQLSIEGLLFNLRAFTSSSTLEMKTLTIGERIGMTSQQFEELKFLVAADKQIKLKSQKLQFYGREVQYLSYDDDRPLDIERCPKCENFRLVYDCPAESCRRHASQFCRGCTLCIQRCFYCGCCISSFDYEEDFCLDIICKDCWNKMLSSQDEVSVVSRWLVKMKH